MRIFITILLLLPLLVMDVQAAPPDRMDADLMRQSDSRGNQQFTARSKGGAAGPSVEDVGDAASFGRNVIYLGLAQTSSVRLALDCSLLPPSETRTCVTLNPAPGVTTFSESDLAVIHLPAKATKSVVCFTVTPFANFQFNNTTGVFQPSAHYFARAVVRIESDVLNDPTLIDPATGLPYGGVLTARLSTFSEDRSLNVNEREAKFHAQTRSCIAGVLNHNNLILTGFSEAQVKQLFREPMTIRFGIEGSAQLVDFASFFYGVRLYGDK